MKFQSFISSLCVMVTQGEKPQSREIGRTLDLCFSHCEWSGCQDNTEWWWKMGCETCKGFQKLKISKGQRISAMEKRLKHSWKRHSLLLAQTCQDSGGIKFIYEGWHLPWSLPQAASQLRKENRLMFFQVSLISCMLILRKQKVIQRKLTRWNSLHTNNALKRKLTFLSHQFLELPEFTHHQNKSGHADLYELQRRLQSSR